MFSIPANAVGMAEHGDDRGLIRELCDWARMTPSEVAREAGLTPSTLTRPLNQPVKHRLSTPTLLKLRLRFPQFPGFGHEPDLPEVPSTTAYVEVSVLPSYAGMGGGGTGEGDRVKALVSRALIEDVFKGRPTDFELIDVRGDSMAPKFLHGDQLLIDKRDRDPVQPGPFALFDGETYLVKNVERVAGRRGWYRIFSTNKEYGDDQIEETETTIMGRPVWFARRL